ncbi:MAG: NAD-binding protein [Anaerolineales bacterium]|nr:NAD-binding protein [Anaerolineales bacterium]
MRRGKILRNLWADYNWFIIILLGTLALVLGYIGFWKNSQVLEEGRTFLDNLYLTLGLISLNSGAATPPISWELQVARFLVPAVTAYTAFLAFTSVFIQQTDRVKLWFIQDHVIICGLGRKGFRLANQFLQIGTPVVVIEIDEGNDWIGNIRSAGAIVMNGDASDPELLKKVKLNHASCLISVAGDDGKNAEVAVNAEMITQTRKDSCLTCIIHIFDAHLWRLLREKELQTIQNSHFRLELFNIFDRGAHLMLQENPPLSDHTTGQAPHILIIGLGKMGQQLVIGSARSWKLSNPNIDKKMEISVIDIAAEQKLQSLQNQNPRLHNLVEFQAINMDLLSGDFDKAAELFFTGDDFNLDIAYICLDDETFCLQTGLRLNHQFRSQSLPFVMRMAESGGLALLLGDDLDKQNRNSFGNLKIFDLLDQTCTAELIQLGTHEILARNLHAVYLEGSQGSGESLGEDDAHVPWDELPDYLKENNRQLADRIPAMLSATGYKIAPLQDWDAENLAFQENIPGDDQVSLMARMEHENWCQGKMQEGWEYGQKKNSRIKHNPNLLPWDDLPEIEKEKNKKYIRDLPKLLARAGFQIEKH